MNTQRTTKMLQFIIHLTDMLKLSEEKLFAQTSKDIFMLSYQFTINYKNKLNKLPYSINLIDELHANENAHSRILCRLLEAHDECDGKNDYFILQSFLTFLEEPFSLLKSLNPQITAEKNRIDARIRDKKFSLIIENKIHNAEDQEKQISRYIENEENFADTQYSCDNNIYVLYLSREGGSPSENSLPHEKRLILSTRYKEINYKEHILKWVTEELLKVIPFNSKNKLITAALIQYKDHLEGLFYEREGKKEMNDNLMNTIKKELGLEGKSVEDKLTILNEKEQSINTLLQYLTKVKNESLIMKLRDDINSLTIGNVKKIECDSDFGKEGKGITFIPENWNERFFIRFEFEYDYNNFFFGIKDTKNMSDSVLIGKLDTVLKKCSYPSEIWPWYQYCEKRFMVWNDTDEVWETIENGVLINYIKENIIYIINNVESVTEFHK